MIYRILADLTVVVHLLFIAFAAGGGILALWRRRLAFLHLPAAAWAVYIEFSGRICPLTPLENRFIRLAGGDGYTSGFIEHYLLPIIYPAGLTRQTQGAIGLFVLVLNAAVYGLLLHRLAGRRKKQG